MQTMRSHLSNARAPSGPSFALVRFAACCALLLQIGCSGDAEDSGGADSGPGGAGSRSPGDSGSSGGSASNPLLGGVASPIDTGVSEGLVLSDMTDAQATQFCTRFAEETVARLGDQICTLSGLVAAAIGSAFGDDLEAARTECTESVDECKQCVSAPGPECNDGEEKLDTGDCKEKTLACSALVAEAESCLGAQLARLRSALAAAPTCEELTDKDLEGSEGDEPSLAEQTPECARLIESCPDFAD